MVVFTWLLLSTSFPSEHLFDVFISAFLPQNRSNTEQLSDYFNKKITPRLEKGHLIYTAFDKNRIISFVIFEKMGRTKLLSC